MNYNEELQQLLTQFHFIVNTSGIDKKELGRILDEAKESYEKQTGDGGESGNYRYHRKRNYPFSIDPPLSYTDNRLSAYLHNDISKMEASTFTKEALENLYVGIRRIRKFRTLEINYKPLDKEAFLSLSEASRIAPDINSHVDIKVHSGSVSDGVKEEVVERSRHWNNSTYKEYIRSFPISLVWNKTVKDKDLAIADISGKAVLTLEAKELPAEQQEWLQEDNILIYKAKVGRVSYKQDNRPGYWNSNDDGTEYDIIDRYIAKYVGEVPSDRKLKSDTGLSIIVATSTTPGRAAGVLKRRIEKELINDLLGDL